MLSRKERKALKRRQKLEQAESARKKRLLKKIAFWGAGFLGLGALVFAIVYLSAGSGNAPSARLSAGISLADHTSGPRTAKVRLIEYSDFQCPACASYYPLLKRLKREFADELLFAYRHFPLRSIHQNAEFAARAAEAAGLQDKFWEMHDLIFEGQKEWSDSGNAQDVFIEYAQFLDIDTARFRVDLDSDAVKQKVRNDYDTGLAAGVAGTPSFFLNGDKISNPRSYEEFRSVIQKELE